MQKTISFTIALQNSVCGKERDTRRKDIRNEIYRTPGRNPGKHPKMRIFSWQNYYGNGHIKVNKPHWNSSDIPRTRKTKSNIPMAAQKNRMQGSLERKGLCWRDHMPISSYYRRASAKAAQAGAKANTETKGIEQRTQKPMKSNKMRKGTCRREDSVSTNSARKTGYPHADEGNWSLSLTLHKI